MAVEITWNPTDKVSNLTAPVHIEKYKYASSWKIPRCLVNQNSESRLEVLKYQWVLTMFDSGSYLGTQYPLEEYTNWDPYNEAVTESTLDLYWIKFWNGYLYSSAGSYKFYPQGSTIIKNIRLQVWAANAWGSGPYAYADTTIEPPKTPSISTLSQDTETGKVSGTITPDKDGFTSLHNPLTDTYWTRVVYDSRTKKTNKKTGTFATENKTLSYDVGNRQQLTYPNYVEFRISAQSRGIGGHSSTKNKSLYIGQPAKPAIITKKIVCPSYGKTGNVVVPINLNAKKTHPVTGVRLQYLNNVTYTKASQIPVTADWQDCGVSDNKTCKSLAVEVSEIASDIGKRTWIRIKTWNQTENLLPNYSAAVQLTKLYKAPPTARDDKCGIVSVTPGSDGSSVTVVIGYTENNTNTGTEVTWADKSNAWRSNEQPDSYTFSWNDSTKKSNKWKKTTTIIIRGLTEGTKYYFRARRYLESDEGTTYTPWSAKMSTTPALAPSNVVLSAPTIVKRGYGCQVGWTYDGGTQKSWRILSNGKVVISGSNKKDRASITASQLINYANSNGVVPLSVEVTTNGGSKASDVNNITLATPPSISISVPNNRCTKQPLVIHAISTLKTSTMTLVVRANGCGAGGPGLNPQIRNDVIWSGSVTPRWVVHGVNGSVVNYLAKIAIPTGLDLRDKARYVVTANAIDPATNLKSADATASFQVVWARKAPEPVVRLTPSDGLSDAGVRTISCKIKIENAPNSLTSDVYDIWRLTPDGEYKVYAGAVRGNIIWDKYAPYGRDSVALKYRVVCRTVDGDVEWDDFSYELYAKELRIDFGQEYVELPYNLSVSDSWTKDFETRQKMDGTIDGYWNDSTERKGSLSSDIIKITDVNTANKIRALAKYAGPCLVRLPDGCCYVANVNIDDFSWAFTDMLMAISISATEINPTETYNAIPQTT